ncbi:MULTISPECIES: ABC transporter permease [Brevibacterium]|uniref:Transport permease protein n=1 Tax=Brevibacterium salitolerans TaxID=1403566 RepID=A0ABN2WUM1_9MICO|nr:ABC transporter permease [Brevibacterium sp.]
MTAQTSRETAAPAEIRGVLLRPEDRPSPSNPLSASLTYGWRALLKIKHIPEQLFDVTVFPIMMTVMMTYVFGGSIGSAVSGAQAGGDAVGAYVQWLIPGVFAQTLVMITMYTGLTLNRDISKGIFDRFRSLPVWRPAQLVGALLGDQVRFTLAGVIILVVGFIMGFRPEGGLTGVLAAFVLLLVFSFCLSWVWTAVALLMRTEQAAMGVSMFILMPLTFVSNIFAPTETMPGPIRAFAEFNPVSTVVGCIRELMAGTFDLGSITMVLVYCAVLVVVFGPISMVIYNRKS